MSELLPVVVPAVPPKGPPLSLIQSSVRPGSGSDPSNPIFELAGEQLAILPDDLRAEIKARQGDSWIRGITYAPENHYTAVNRSGYDSSSVDEAALPAPTGLALAQVAGGTLAAGAYSYQVTAVNANGQTTALAAVSITTTATGSVQLTWNQTAEVTYNVYGRVAGSVGLLASGIGPFDDDQTPTWTDTGAASPGAAPPSSNTTAGPGSYGNLPIVTCIPWLVLVEDSCSTWGFEERDFKGRAQRLLQNATPQAIEREFWTGALAQAQGWPNNYLANGAADLTPATVPSVARGQQILQDYLASTGFGGQGMIHCQPQSAPNLLNARRVGNLLLDIFDNIIVAGVGYPGTGPVGNANQTPPAGQAWMYVSDLVMTRVEDEATVIPDTFSEAVDRGQAGEPNRVTFRAMKYGCAYFDGAVQAAVRVTLES